MALPFYSQLIVLLLVNQNKDRKRPNRQSRSQQHEPWGGECSATRKMRLRRRWGCRERLLMIFWRKRKSCQIRRNFRFRRFLGKPGGWFVSGNVYRSIGHLTAPPIYRKRRTPCRLCKWLVFRILALLLPVHAPVHELMVQLHDQRLHGNFGGWPFPPQPAVSSLPRHGSSGQEAPDPQHPDWSPVLCKPHQLD